MARGSKDARIILENMRRVCPEGVFPGHNQGRRGDWELDAFHILISTVLSQRTKDSNTFSASSALFREFNTPEQIANAPLDRLKSLVRPAGFPEAKAKAIKEIARIIHEEMGGQVPADREELMRLPMVGRKTANCVLAYAFKKDAICVDTHVHRISNRIGLVRTNDPEETELALMKIIPQELWRDVNSYMVRFGQRICLPRNPRCYRCPLTKFCDFYTISEKGEKVRSHASRTPKGR
ncbi:MAG: endonuclease III [Methanomassiliicoccales archaeon]